MSPWQRLSPALLTIIVIHSGCESPTGPVSRGEIRALNRAEARWKARPFIDYVYETQTSCFCPPELNQWTRVTVRGGVVVGAEFVEPRPDIQITTLSAWASIDTVFVRLRQRLASPALEEVYAEFEADYDPQLGFPTRIEFRERPNVNDATTVQHIRNLRPLE